MRYLVFVACINPKGETEPGVRCNSSFSSSGEANSSSLQTSCFFSFFVLRRSCASREMR